MPVLYIFPILIFSKITIDNFNLYYQNHYSHDKGNLNNPKVI